MPRMKIMNVRFSDAEATALTLLAERESLPASTYVRRLIRLSMRGMDTTTILPAEIISTLHLDHAES